MKCHVSPPPRPSPPASPKRHPSASCISFLLPLPFRLHRRRLACGASLFRAYRVGARARGARELVARASQAQGARLLYLSDCICIGGAALGLRNRKGGPASRLSSTPILPRLPPCQIPGAAGPEFSPMSRPEGRVYPPLCHPGRRASPLCHPGRRVSADPGSSLPGRCRVSRAVLDPGSGAGVTIEEGRGDN